MPVHGWTIALQIVNFLVLVWLLNRFLYKPVARMIAARRQQVDDAFARAADKEREAAETQSRYEALIEGIEAERQRILGDAGAQAEAENRHRIKEAEAKAAEIRAGAEREAQQKSDALAVAAADWAIDAAVELATRLLVDATTATAPSGVFLQRVLETLRALGEDQLANLRRDVAAGGDLQLVSAGPLEAAQQALFREQVREVLAVAAPVTFQIDPALIAGVEVRFPHAIIADNWRQTLTAARQRLLDHARFH